MAEEIYKSGQGLFETPKYKSPSASDKIAEGGAMVDWSNMSEAKFPLAQFGNNLIETYRQDMYEAAGQRRVERRTRKKEESEDIIKNLSSKDELTDKEQKQLEKAQKRANRMEGRLGLDITDYSGDNPPKLGSPLNYGKANTTLIQGAIEVAKAKRNKVSLLDAGVSMIADVGANYIQKRKEYLNNAFNTENEKYNPELAQQIGLKDFNNGDAAITDWSSQYRDQLAMYNRDASKAKLAGNTDRYRDIDIERSSFQDVARTLSANADLATNKKKEFIEAYNDGDISTATNSFDLQNLQAITSKEAPISIRPDGSLFWTLEDKETTLDLSLFDSWIPTSEGLEDLSSMFLNAQRDAKNNLEYNIDTYAQVNKIVTAGKADWRSGGADKNILSLMYDVPEGGAGINFVEAYKNSPEIKQMIESGEITQEDVDNIFDADISDWNDTVREGGPTIRETIVQELNTFYTRQMQNVHNRYTVKGPRDPQDYEPQPVELEEFDFKIFKTN
jgi:hypothetical protein|tara:strand:+ start:12466 stop:13974 length:1509 start_codon:yes stop_codon:yes gene_type:complete